VLRAVRLVVLIDAEERKVQVVTRVREVVRVASEESELDLGRDYQPDIREPAEYVRRIAAAVVQAYDLHPDGIPGRGMLGLGCWISSITWLRAASRSSSDAASVTANTSSEMSCTAIR